MFVLSRRKDDQVRLRVFDSTRQAYTTVTVTVAKIGRRRVKLRFDAPDSVIIERPDYLDRIGATSYGAERPDAG